MCIDLITTDTNIAEIKDLFGADPKAFNKSLQSIVAYKIYQLAKTNKSYKFCVMYCRYFMELPQDIITILDEFIRYAVKNKQNFTENNDTIKTYFASLSTADFEEITKNLDLNTYVSMILNLQKNNLLTR